MPQTVSESKSKKLLIKEYRPTENKVIINQGEYKIVEAFITFKLNSKNDQTINKNFFEFSVRIKNLKQVKRDSPLKTATMINSFIFTVISAEALTMIILFSIIRTLIKEKAWTA